MTESSKINRQRLLVARDPGIHTVDQPLTGFKKIHCNCDPVPRGFWPFIFQAKGTKQIDAIAELEIPVGATVVRPTKIIRGNYRLNNEPIRAASNKLRTDKVFVKKIEPANSIETFLTNFFYPLSQNSECYSHHDHLYNHHDDQQKIPIYYGLNENIYEKNAPGIHFFATKEEAENYKF